MHGVKRLVWLALCVSVATEHRTAWAQRVGGPPQSVPTSRGSVTVTPSEAAKPTSPAMHGQRRHAKFSFEFAKAEVMDVVKAVSDMTGQNFIIPEKLKGQRITILSPTKVSASEAYQVFYSALSANGIAVVRSGQFYKLMDSKDAIKDTIPTCVDDDAACASRYEQMVTLLLHLRHTDVGQINTVVRSLLSRDGDVTIFQPSNAMIVSEYSPNLQRLRRIVEALDVPGFNDELQLVQIQYSSAAEIAEKITQIFEVSTRASIAPAPTRPSLMPGMPSSINNAASQNDDSDVQISKIVPDDRTNQIIIKANKRSFEAIKKLVAKLDVPISETDQGRVHVYYLENAKAEELASTLSSFTTTGGDKKKATGAPMGAPGIPPQARGAVEPSATSLFEGDVKITADKATNSLVIMSSGHDYRSLRNIIERLDKARRQIYVEAAIMEVNVSTGEDVALNWHFPIQFKEKTKLFGFLPVDNNSLGGVLQSAQSSNVSPTFMALQSLQNMVTAAGGALGGVFGSQLNFTLGDGTPFKLPSFGLMLKWLETTSNVNILSTPHLLTTDNEQAHIEVGSKVPFNSGLLGGLQGMQSGGMAASAAGALGGLSSLGGIGALSGLGSSVQRIDVSLKLTITPQINEHNKIRLEIDQSVEDLSGENNQSQTPTTSHRALKTVVVTNDQQTVVLGGLMRDRTSDSETKIPLLGDIPIVGYFFKKRNDKVEKSNLLLVLTPYIISSQADFQRIFERKLAEHEEFSALYYGHRKEYRAHIDYSKKSGPFSRMVRTIARERERFENGGEGDGSELLVKPKGKGSSSESGGAAPDSPPAPVPQPDAAGKGERLPGTETFKPAPAPAGLPEHSDAGAPAEPPQASDELGDASDYARDADAPSPESEAMIDALTGEQEQMREPRQ